MDIGVGSGIVLDLVLLADRTNVKPNPIDLFFNLQRFEGRVCIFLAVCFQNTRMHRARIANR